MPRKTKAQLALEDRRRRLKIAERWFGPADRRPAPPRKGGRPVKDPHSPYLRRQRRLAAGAAPRRPGRPRITEPRIRCFVTFPAFYSPWLSEFHLRPATAIGRVLRSLDLSFSRKTDILSRLADLLSTPPALPLPEAQRRADQALSEVRSAGLALRRKRR